MDNNSSGISMCPMCYYCFVAIITTVSMPLPPLFPFLFSCLRYIYIYIDDLAVSSHLDGVVPDLVHLL